MGMVVQSDRFSSGNQMGLLKPILYCYSNGMLRKQAISINVELAQRLSKYKPERRTLQAEKAFSEVVATLPDDCIIKDFDVMFNPMYRIDVLRIFINTYKLKPFSVLWPGKLEGKNLTYAEEGFEDFKVYNLDNYDITCVI